MDTFYKLLVDFLNWGEPRFSAKAELIVTSMTTEPMLTLLPDPLPTAVMTRVAMVAALANYKAAALLAEGGDRALIVDRNDKRAALEDGLKDWMPVVELAAKKAGSTFILENSGYDLRQPPQPQPQPLPAPELKVFRNGLSGEIDGRGTSITGALCYEGQCCLGADTQTGTWQTAFFTSRPTKLVYEGLTPGQMYSFRLRALGRNGWSAWSDIAQLMAA